MRSAASPWLACTFLPRINRTYVEKYPAPGVFARRLGVNDVLGFLAGHVIYAVTVGALYPRILQWVSHRHA